MFKGQLYMSNSPPDENAPINPVIVNLLIHHALTEAPLSQCRVGLWGENKEQTGPIPVILVHLF